MNKRPQVIAEFINDFEEKAVVHRDARGRIRMKRTKEAVALALSCEIGRIAGERIRAERKRQGLTMLALARRAGLTATKQRMREIECQSPARTGLRIGTIYALAWALEVDPSTLLPTLEEAMRGAGVGKLYMGETLAALSA